MSAWWRDAVIYQLYLRSFADGDGDGVGDLHGLLRRLDYLCELGVDGFWLNPCYPSPQADHGYDVADYTDIDPGYGNLATFDTVLEQAHARGLKVLLDLVPNHCSARHPWFRAALAAPPGSSERERFVFRDGRGPAGELPPNNWASVFGGPAWTRVTEPDGTPGQWYLHMFDPVQPDFNWRDPRMVLPDEQRQDPIWFRSGGTDRGRDGCRLPLPWRSGSPETSFGFTDTGSTPWLPPPWWFDAHAVDVQLADPRSTLNLHRSALELRRQVFPDPADDQAVTWLAAPGAGDVLALRRDGAVCGVNFGDSPVELPVEWGEPVLRSDPAPDGTLPPDTAAWLA